MQTLEVRFERKGESAHVELAGELDMYSAGRLEQELEALARDGCDTVLLDLRRLSYVDSTGLATILAASRRAKEAGRRFAVVRGPDSIQWRFRTTGIDRLLEMVDDPAAVLPG